MIWKAYYLYFNLLLKWQVGSWSKCNFNCKFSLEITKIDDEWLLRSNYIKFLISTAWWLDFFSVFYVVTLVCSNFDSLKSGRGWGEAVNHAKTFAAQPMWPSPQVHLITLSKLSKNKEYDFYLKIFFGDSRNIKEQK